MTRTSRRSKKRPLFISWRWRIVVPLFAVSLVVAMLGAYVLAMSLGDGFALSQDNILLESVRGLSDNADALYARQVQEAQRVAFTIGVPEAVSQEEVDVLPEQLEALARTADMDSILLVDANGVEALGVLRATRPEVDDYSVNIGTELGNQPVVQSALQGEPGAAGFMRTPEGILLYVGVPLRTQDAQVGAVLVGLSMETLLANLYSDVVAQVAVYGQDGALIRSTLPDNTQQAATVSSELLNQTLTADLGTVPIRSLTISDALYRVAYTPLNYGPDTLGLAALFLPDSVPFATSMGRQLSGLMAAMIAGAAVTVTFVGVALYSGRVSRVQKTAEALARGKADSRTGMAPVDEAGAAGAALDAYATRVKQEQAALNESLRRQRRETSHMVSVLESLPDGVIVQDLHGEVTLMNEEARRLLGSQDLQQVGSLKALSRLVREKLGPSIAPGIYALGDPQEISVNNRMLSAQAAVLMSLANERLGNVIVVRDITQMVRQEQARDRLLSQMERDVTGPLADLAQSSAFDEPLSEFTREITQRAVALQKLVVEMRELTEVDVHDIAQVQKPLRLDTLIWAVANEWRQIAQAAGLKLHVIIDEPGLYILGDERRLRWAMGNILDNAVKYTPPEGAITLEITGQSDGKALLRTRDNGVGISPDELNRVTTRFYRGNPTTRSGEIIRTPGMGQGLYLARQILEAHGGNLQVRSKQQVGTAVYFALPLTSAVSLDLPVILDSLEIEGETVKLPEGYMPELRL